MDERKLTNENKNYLNKIIKISFFTWLICVIGVLVTIEYVGIKEEIFDQAPEIFFYLILGLIIIGSLAFLVGIISFASKLILKKSQKKQNIFVFLIKLFFILPVFPLYLFFYVINPIEIIKKIKEKKIKGLVKNFTFKLFIKKILVLVIVILIFLPIWIVGYTVLGIIIVDQLGYLEKPIPIAGTGSMYPTFPKGEGKDPEKLAKQIVGYPGMIRYPNGLVIAGKRYFNYEIGRGDIVVIENKKIKEITKKMHGQPSGWVKRVIALSGDSLELREGIVYLNNKPLKEPYTAKARSTFGQDFLKECQKVVVPKNHIFVMGDNRKGSSDSREIGFIEISAVTNVLPLKNQKGDLVKNWRDTSKDFDESSKIKLDKEKYLTLLNEKRKEAGAQELKYQPKLELSAQKRGEIVLKFNDFSYEATKSGYTMKKAMSDVGYSNIVWNEGIIQGYFEAEELIEYLFEFPDWKKNLLLDKNLQELGIAEVEGKINGCPTQVIVQHLAGYIPPNYSKEVIDSWKTALERLKEIQPGWAKLKEYSEFYEKNKKDIDRINEIISIRIVNISAIVSKMEDNQWLTAAEEKMAEDDDLLYKEQEEIAKRLNSQN